MPVQLATDAGARRSQAVRRLTPAGGRPGRRRLSDIELRRKAWHTLPGFLAFVLPLVPHSDPLAWYELAAVTVRVALLTILALIFRRMIARPNERGLAWAILAYAGCVLGTLLLFPSHCEFAVAVLVVIAFGDSAAEVVGVLFGRRHLSWNRAKTWAGLTGFVLCAGPLAALAFWLAAQPAVSFGLAAACGMAAAIAGGFAESLRTRLTDNLRIGVAAAVAVVTVHALLATA